MNTSNMIRWSLTLGLGVAAFFFWWLGHPELLSFHEQNQLFLFTSDYFMERTHVAGALAEYVGDWLVQFYYYPSIGAAIVGTTLVVLMSVLYQALLCHLKGWRWAAFALALAATLLMWAHMLDENTMLSYPIALIMTLFTYLLCRRGGWGLQLLVIFPLYWIAGPVFVVLPFFAMCDAWRDKHWTQALLASLLLTGATVGWVYLCRTLWFAQYPWDTVLAGIGYYRLTLFTCNAPHTQYDVLLYPLVIGLSATWISRGLDYLLNPRHSVAEWIATSVIVAVMSLPLYRAFVTDSPHDLNTHVILEQTYQIRKGDWHGIITKAETYKQQDVSALKSPLSCGAVNLALAKTGQLANRMFEFPQAGIQGLIMPNVRDNVSNVTSMEVFWHLGFVNESMRYAFDSQESIPNCRKSARFTKRMAECNIVNGKYDVASKYIDMLRHTLFYRDWAEQAAGCLYDEAKINSMQEWQTRRALRLENDFLYYYPELSKMLGQLVLHHRDNRMAYDYFMASLLLTGDTRSFVANLPQPPQQGTDPFPHGYKDYYEYMQEHGTPSDIVTSATSLQ